MRSAAGLAVLLPHLLLAAAGDGGEVSLDAYSADVRGRVVRKIRETLNSGGRPDEIGGTVTFAGRGRFFVQGREGALKVLFSGKPPREGERVRVSGHPSIEGGRIVFVAREWKGVGRGEVRTPREVAAAELVDAESRLDGRRVAVCGRAIGLTESGFAVKVDSVPVNVVADELPDFLGDCERTNPKVRVTGVVELLFDSSSLLDGESGVMGVKINVAAPRDIELEPDASYLAAKRDARFVIVSTLAFLLLLAGLCVFVVVVFRQRRGLFKTRTIMAERKRMADDIHDTIEQHLVGAGMLLKINRIEEAQGVLVRAKREIRDIVWGLKNDDMMRLSPAEMIRKLAHEENTKGIFRVDTRLEGLPERMDASLMRDLSLIIRETIGNAVKHGGARRIAIVSETAAGGGWVLRISNDGEPFDPQTAPGAKEGHFGIEGMKQRARRIGATLFIERRNRGMVLILSRAGT